MCYSHLLFRVRTYEAPPRRLLRLARMALLHPSPLLPAWALPAVQPRQKQPLGVAPAQRNLDGMRSHYAYLPILALEQSLWQSSQVGKCTSWLALCYSAPWIIESKRHTWKKWLHFLFWLLSQNIGVATWLYLFLLGWITSSGEKLRLSSKRKKTIQNSQQKSQKVSHQADQTYDSAWGCKNIRCFYQQSDQMEKRHWKKSRSRQKSCWLWNGREVDQMAERWTYKKQRKKVDPKIDPEKC